MKAYNQRPEVKKRNNERQRTPRQRALLAKYRARPEARARHREYMRAYWKNPEVKARHRERVRTKYHEKQIAEGKAVPRHLNDDAITLWLSEGFTPLARTEDKKPILKD
jgi:hypothetical protein